MIPIKSTCLAAFAVLILSVSSAAQDIDNPLEINGYVRNYTGILTGGNNEFSIIQNTLNLRFEKQMQTVGFKANPVLYHYGDNSMELNLREAYMDLHFNKVDIRIGKQQIIWGKAEGVFITDIVSPKDLREFLLPDFDEIRQGVTAFSMKYYAGNHTFEAVWSPLFNPTTMPELSSIWRPTINYPVPILMDFSNSAVNPSLKNSEVFFRYSAMTPKIDYEVVAGHFYYDDPTQHITKQIDTTTMQLSGLTIRPQYHRVSMAGGSFSLPLGPLVVRTEGAYYTNRYFQTSHPLATDGTIKKDNLHYMLGIDYTLLGVKLSVQLIQEQILDFSNEIATREFEPMATFLIKKDFLREKLWIELFTYTGLKDGDALIRPKVTYAFADSFELLGGANIFVGTNGRFGQFDQNDMVFAKIKYSF